MKINGLKQIKKTLVVTIITFAYIVLALLILNNLISALILGFVFFFIVNFVIVKKINNGQEKIELLNEFQQLANSLIMQLATTPSILDACKTISKFFKSEVQEVLENDELDISDKMSFLNQRYHFALFSMFEKLIDIYVNQGGNILKMSLQLLNEIDYLKLATQEIHLDNKKKIREVVILWLLSFLCVIILRFSLNSYYEAIIKSNFFYVLLMFLLGFTFSMLGLYISYSGLEL
ncbi:MAG: hypothetical protein LBM99_04415 [Bacillales bacterium]|jgi:hypothetical protein|nr:hypothetical protein [Bacillales bacterium]